MRRMEVRFFVCFHQSRAIASPYLFVPHHFSWETKGAHLVGGPTPLVGLCLFFVFFKFFSVGLPVFVF